MATIVHNPYLQAAKGRHAKDGLVERQKFFRDYDGGALRPGKFEGYIPKKRNFITNPPTLGEQANQQAFGANSHEAMEFINAWKNHTPLPEKKQAFLDEVKERFKRQLSGKHDRIAPKDKFGKYTIYMRPDNFLRAVLKAEHPVFD